MCRTKILQFSSFLNLIMISNLEKYYTFFKDFIPDSDRMFT